jgi:hypothetical protein
VTCATLLWWRPKYWRLGAAAAAFGVFGWLQVTDFGGLFSLFHLVFPFFCCTHFGSVPTHTR